MKTAKELENYIFNQIKSKKWKINKVIPTEESFIKQFNLSKMTIRKAISLLKEKEIVYTIRGKGTFVSPFYENSRFISLKKILKATKVISHRGDIEKSKIIQEYILKNKYKYLSDKEICVIRKYYIEDEVVAFSTNWINISTNLFKKYDLKNVDNNIFDIHNFDKVVTINYMKPSTKYERNILNINLKYLPIGVSYYLTSDRKVLMTRIYVVLPKYFKVVSINSRN